MRAFKQYVILLALFGGVANAECFIDGANVPRCQLSHEFKSPTDYQGVSWPVFTADTPAEVWSESIRRGGEASVYSIPTVKHVRLDTPEHYPDVVCFDFYHAGVKHSQVCFDTMEITER